MGWSSEAVVKVFVEGESRGKEGHLNAFTGGLWIEDDDAYCYGTKIARWDGDVLLVANIRHYECVVRNLQLLLDAVQEANINMKTVEPERIEKVGAEGM